MEKFYPKNFFDLVNFEHREVFLEDQPVWETLKNIKSYIEDTFKSGKLSKQTPEQPDVYYCGDNISIGEGTKIYPNVYIADNTIIGKNCEIRPGAFFRGNVIVGDNCVIGNSSELKTVIMINKSNAPHYNYVGDTIIGSGCNLGAGTITGNLRLDDQVVKIKINDELVITGLRKFGMVLGDGSQTGCNCVTNPGTIVYKNAVLAGSMSHKGVIPEGSKSL